MDVLALVLAGSTAAGGLGSAFLWLETRGSRSQEKRKAEVTQAVAAALGPVHTELHDLRARVEMLASARPEEYRGALMEALEPMKKEITSLTVKVDPLWKALEQLAINNAQVLHHPDRLRRDIDQLLDRFMEDRLTPDDKTRLRKYLMLIKSWEPGQDLGFPVFDGEPAAAANLLSMLDLVHMYRAQERVK